MFNFLKKRKSEDTKKLTLLLEKIFANINEPFLLKEIQDGVIAKIQLGFNGSFDIFFTEKAALYEMQTPKINTVFQKIKVQDAKGSYSDLEITIIDNLVAGLKFSNSNFDYHNVSLINTDSIQKNTNQQKNEYITEKLVEFGFDITNIPICEIYEVTINNKKYTHLRDVFDGDFIGLLDNKLYWLRHEENQELLIPPKLYNFFSKEIFQASDDEVHEILINLL